MVAVGLSEEQQEIRAKGVGASEVASLVGLDPYAGPIDLYRRKVEGFRSEDTVHTERGRFLEDAILRWYEQRTGNRLDRCGSMAHETHPLVLATPDALVPDVRVVEAKAPGWRTAHEWDDGAVPDKYVAQATQQMAVTGLDTADIVAYLDEDLRIVTVDYDAELAASLIDAIETFWRKHVIPRIPPPPDASKSYSEWVKDRFAKTRGEVLTATPEVEAWARRLIAAKKQLAAIEEEERLARNHLEMFIGDAGAMHGEGFKLSYKHNKSSTRVDWEGLANDVGYGPEQLSKHSYEKPGPRVFRLTEKKDK
jgi:putative phage-type endonuclease